MKRCVTIVLLLVCIMMSLSANGEVNLPQKQRTKEKAILSALSSTEYKKWTIYVPSDAEIEGKRVLSSDLYKKGRYFPVIAVKKDAAVFVLLERNGKKWKVLYANPLAICREDFVLMGFSVNSSDFQVDNPDVLMHFRFNSKTNPEPYGLYTLYVLLDYSETPCTFRFFVNSDKSQLLKPFIGSTNVSYDTEGYQFSYQDPISHNMVDFVMEAEGLSADFKFFDLSSIPLCPQQVMEQASLNQLFHRPMQDVKMYRDLDAADVIYVLQGEAEVYYAPAVNEGLGKEVYLVQYKDTLGYIIE